MRRVTIAAFLLLVCGALQAQVIPDTTEDGLVRAPSSRKVGVYRAPGVAFTQYQRIELGEITVKFRKSWERNNSKLGEDEVESIRADMAGSFRSELVQELVKRGGYALADRPSTDTLRVDAFVLDLDVTAPEASTSRRDRVDTLIRSAGSMKLVVELRDGASGAIIGRIIDYYSAPESQEPQLATQVSNADQFRLGFAEASRYTHEALAVAKTERPK